MATTTRPDAPGAQSTPPAPPAPAHATTPTTGDHDGSAHRETPAVPPGSARAIPPGQLFIGGRWRDASDGRTYPTSNPATEEVITSVALGTAYDADAAARAARAAFDGGPWATMKASERAQILRRIGDLILERADDLATREAMDNGMLYRDARTIVVPHIANMFHYYAGWATKLEGRAKTVEPVAHEGRILAYTRRQPLGVVAAITPFNFPLVLTVSKIAPALAAGNTFIHKPATDTPLSAVALARIIQDAGVPDGVYNLVTGPGALVGDALVKHPLVDKIALTGSTGSGRGVIRDSAETLKHLTMELGGKSPNIVFADADLDQAAATAFYAIMWNKGEVCVAGSRLFVERPAYQAIVDRLVAHCEAAKTGDPFDPASDIGPIASKAEFDKVLRYIDVGKREDKARLATGGNALTVNGTGYYIEPTVFADATNDMRIAREEIFGPVLPVIPFDTEDEAVRLANDTPYGLAGGVQTRDLAKAIRVAERIDAGTLWLNTWHLYDPSAPFGGFKLSGYGREHGEESLENYTQYKTIWANLES